ncbi:MAG: ribosome maturation factor RimP [Thermodesulfobacteriales bacterium]|nr:MAG: ribosome maturation factor RimP [Thermodesulfobacteriales bacterium]
MGLSEDNIISNIKELLEPLLYEKNLELFDIEFKGLGSKGILRVFIDKEQGVTVNDCAQISRELGRLLEVHDVIPGSYTLEISSPGLTRALKKPSDYLRYKGKTVKIKTLEDIEDRKVFKGILLDFVDETVSLQTDGVNYLIPYKNIEKANLELDL